MKRTFLLGMVALFIGTFAFTSCKKEKEEKPTEITIEAADITASSAVVNVSVTGAEPQLIRFADPVTVESLEFDLNDEASVAEFASKGTAIGTPYSTQFQSLAPATEYFTAAVAYDANFKVVCVATKTFTTLVPDNAIGDENGAGEIKNERW